MKFLPHVFLGRIDAEAVVNRPLAPIAETLLHQAQSFGEDFDYHGIRLFEFTGVVDHM